MNKRKVVITAGDVITPYGPGLEVCWEAVMASRCALRPVPYLNTESFQSSLAGLIQVGEEGYGSRVLAMVEPLLKKDAAHIPEDAIGLLATTIGEIEYLERAVLNGSKDAEESCPVRLLSKIEKTAGLKKSGLVISAACASSAVAIADGAGRIADGEEEAVLVVACDGVSEFLFSGFSSLLALDPEFPRPFDRDRAGLCVGEAAGYLVLMSEERALRERRTILGEVSGWGVSNDANHMTGPSRTGEGLILAIHQALADAGLAADKIASISAHGTGTLYNDAMEMAAFKQVFTVKPLPVYSLKGGMGHTMAAAGLVEVLIALKSLSEQKVPPTIGLRHPAPEAEGWVSGAPQKADGDFSLTTNSGFGGVNAALILKRRQS